MIPPCQVILELVGEHPAEPGLGVRWQGAERCVTVHGVCDLAEESTPLELG